MKSKSRVAMLIGIMTVIMLMPIIPNYVATQTVQEAYAAGTADSEERTASYEEKAVDIVAYAKQDILTEESIFKGKAVATNTEYLAVMTEPDSSAEMAGKLFEYNIADVVSQDKGWTKITSGSLTGFVETNALCFDSEAESVAKLETEVSIVPASSEAVIYSSYASEAEVVGTLTAESEAVPVSRIGDYVKILQVDGSSAYVLGSETVIDYGFDTGLTIEEEAAKIAAEEAARKAAEEAARKAAEEEAARKAAEEARRKAIIERTISGTDFTYNPTMEISEDDLWILACIIDWESGWEPYEGKLAVANIVLNRVRSSHYPGTVHDVVYARSQFGGVLSGGQISSRFAERLANGPRTDECMEAALEALSGKNNIGSYTAFNGTEYIDFSRVTDYVIIGGHCFY
ncbi:MAG: cell wall hydrolase [Clostridia bacterium]|nr:cell wall hydrolase [Clostridia bacterium]